MRRNTNPDRLPSEPLPADAAVPCRAYEDDGSGRPESAHRLTIRFRGFVALVNVWQETDGSGDPRDGDNVGAISWSRDLPYRRGGDDERPRFPKGRAVWSFADIVAACEREELRAAVAKAGADPDDAEAVAKIADAAGLDADNFGAEAFAGLVLPFYPHGTYSSDDDYTGGQVYRLPEGAGGLLETLSEGRGKPCGVLYADAETIRHNFAAAGLDAFDMAKAAMQCELETYSAWCRGDVYGYKVTVGRSYFAAGIAEHQEARKLEDADDEGAACGGFVEAETYPFRDTYVVREGRAVARRALAAAYLAAKRAAEFSAAWDHAEAFAGACRY